MASTAALPTFRDSAGGWIGSPVWDGFWMFSSIWGSALLLLVSFQLGFDEAGPILFAANIAIALCHSWSTTYMVIGSRMLRDVRRANRRKFSYVPAAVVAGSMAVGLLVATTGAFPTSLPVTSDHWIWLVYLALFWVGHFWHFGNQDFGVLSIYRLKSGQTSTRDRKVDKAYAVAMMFVIQPVVYMKALATSPLAEAFFGIVPVSPELVASGAMAAVAIGVGGTAAVVVFELSKPNTSVAKLLYYTVMLSHPTILFLLQFKLGFFYMITYFWSHWFIAIGLVGRINTHYHEGRGYAPFAAVLRHALALCAAMALAAWIYHEYSALSLFSARQYKEILAVAVPQSAWIVGALLGFFLAEQLLHYYCDRCLFRFRDASVRKAVAPLL